jgi:hypothetical protein
MASPIHSKQVQSDGIHTPVTWTFSSSANRLLFTASSGSPVNLTDLTAVDLYKMAIQTDNNSAWILTSISPLTWNTIAGIWIDGGGKLLTSASVSIDPASRYANQIGTDVLFFVSGSTGVASGSNRQVAVFGGDVMVSGSMIERATITVITGNYTILATDYIIHLSQSLNNVTCTLPPVATKYQYMLKDIVGSGSSFPFLLKRAGSERIDNAASDKTLQTNLGAWFIWSDGTNVWSSGGP